MTIGVNGAIAQAERSRTKGGKPAYTAKQKKFLSLFTKNDFKDVAECAKKAGYKSSPYLIVSQLKDDIIEVARSVMVANAPEAALSIANLLSSDKPTPNANVKLQAAKEVLDRAGVVKPEKHEHEHHVSGGIFLMPVKHELPEEKAINGEFEEIKDEV